MIIPRFMNHLAEPSAFLSLGFNPVWFAKSPQAPESRPRNNVTGLFRKLFISNAF
jgi:hypothetical protein